MENKHYGTVKYINTEKFYGFIRENETGQDIFFHGKELTNLGMTELAKDDQVEYSIGDSPKGPRAINIVVDLG